jgi:hypothetical protein
MNGRIYDPTLGRFLQADPHIQAPANSQNYNRYSYVLNNPMSYTDPSGYFFSKLNKMFGKFAPFVSIAAMIFIPGAWAFATESILGAVTTGFFAGGIATGSLRGAITGAFAAATFYGIGSHFEGLEDAGGVLTNGAKFGKTVAHGVAGGLSSVLGGGKFGHGFASAGFTQAMSFAIDKIGGRYGNVSKSTYGDMANRVKRVVASAIAGGTASAVAGGKFASGAVTGAFSRIFNDEANLAQKIVLFGMTFGKVCRRCRRAL